MITDEKRREIAEEIRSKTLYTRGSLGDWWMRLHEAVTDEEDFPCPAETMAAIADLIDRPTATASMNYEAMEDGVPDCRIWTCDKCNGSFPVYRGFSPAYCPNCGAEVITDD